MSSSSTKVDLRQKSKFWRKYPVKELLIRVRNNKESLENAAAKIGVSRKEVEKRCGGIKSKEEIEAVEEQERIERVNKQEEAAQRRGSKELTWTNKSTFLRRMRTISATMRSSDWLISGKGRR